MTGLLGLAAMLAASTHAAEDLDTLELLARPIQGRCALMSPGPRLRVSVAIHDTQRVWGTREALSVVDHDIQVARGDSHYRTRTHM